MAMDPRTPVIVGAGQLCARDRQPGRYHEPAALATAALRAAANDSGAGERLLAVAQSLRCVAVAGWRYGDLGALVAADLGISPRETVQTNMFGGDGPQRLVGETAQEIAQGRLEVALICGAEAVSSLLAAQRDGVDPGWRKQGPKVAPSRISGEDRPPVNAAEAAVGLAAPIDLYALIQTALAHAAGERIAEHLQRIAALWSSFSEVAAANPFAWLGRAHSAQEIASPSPTNRLVSHPYTKLLCANIAVDQAAALILTSAEAARRAGVPRERWVFVHVGAHGQDTWHVSERATLTASPAIAALGRAALEHAGVSIDEIAHLDIYSCFPCAVQLAADALGCRTEDRSRPLTVTGGLTFAGGPGNNYSTHGIAALIERLRSQPSEYGLATALGWYATKHALGVYSAREPRRPYGWLEPWVAHGRPRAARSDHRGQATLEAFTVRRDREQQPTDAIVFALTPDGERALARTEDPEAIAALLEDEPLGRRVLLGDDRVVLA